MTSEHMNTERGLELSESAPPAEDLSLAVAAIGLSAAEGFAYSGALAAAVGAGLTLAVGGALGGEDVGAASALVGLAVFFLYGVDRLRDVARDRTGSPGRTDFVLRRRRGLRVGVLIAGVLVAAILAVAPWPVFGLCGVLGAVGLLHRRLKQSVPWKIGYVAAAWTAACVGIPWLLVANRGAHGPAIWATALVAAALVGNLIASNLRDGKAAGWPSHRTPEARIAAAAFAALGVAAAAVVAAPQVAALAWIPAAEAVALAFHRPSERYAHLAVDGALLVGALLAMAQAALGG